MDKVCIYARVSTLELQDFERQISDLTKAIKRDGYSEEQIDVFAEKVSGYKKDADRIELTKLLNAIEQDPTKYKAIYISEISRLGREPQTTRKLIDRLCELNVQLYIHSHQLRTLNPDGSRNNFVSIILQIAIEFSDIETQQMKSRMKSGKLQKVTKEGKVSGANQAYGYMADENKNFVINPNESIVVENIFQMYKDGNSTGAIANTLNQMGVKTRLATTHADKTLTFKKTNIEKSGSNIIWNEATIRQILMNTTYKGKRVFKGTAFDCPAIVEADLFDECTQIRMGKTHRNYLTSYVYLFKDMLYCGKCGKKYMGVYSTRKKDSKVYKCTSCIIKGGMCGNLSLNINLFESVIYDQLIKSDNILKYLDNPNDLIKEVEADLLKLEQSLLNEKSSLVNKEKEIDKLIDLFATDNQYLLTKYKEKENIAIKELENIQSKINLIEREIFSKKLIISNFDAQTASVDMLIKAKANRTELRTIFRQFIDKIIINTLNKKYTLITIYIKINGVVLRNTLKTVIDASGIRAVRHKSRQVYQYFPILKMENDPVFKNNVLMVDTNDILQEFEYQITAHKETDGTLGRGMTKIKQENLILMEDSYPLTETKSD